MHVIQYMKGGGTISPHKDPIVYQKIQVGSVLNELGKDFNSGGFSVFNNKKEKVFIEPKLKKGSLVCFMPSLYHTVDPVDLNDKIEDLDIKNLFIVNGLLMNLFFSTIKAEFLFMTLTDLNNHSL